MYVCVIVCTYFFIFACNDVFTYIKVFIPCCVYIYTHIHIYVLNMLYIYISQTGDLVMCVLQRNVCFGFKKWKTENLLFRLNE